MTKTIENYVIIGRFGRPHGIHGWITVCPVSDNKDTILKYQPWMVETRTGWENILIINTKSQSKKIAVQLQDINTPEEARMYTGKKIAVSRSQLPELGQNEYYWTDLEGLTVINQENKKLGQISYLFRTGSNDVMVIQGEKRYLIPFLHKDVVLNIDLNNRIIQINWDSEF